MTMTMTTAAALADDEILARLGIKPAEPFDWGDENSLTSTSARTQNAPLTGLDSLIRYYKDTNCSEDDAQERQILQTLFRRANIDLSTPNESFYLIEKKSGVIDDRKNALPDEMMDVSIKGLSDRAVAELNVECRTSLFGSILRLFDAPRKEEIIGGSNNSEKNNGTGDQSFGKEDNTATAMDVEVEGTNASLPPAAVADSAPSILTASPTSTPPTISEEIKSMIMKEPILSTAEIVRTVHLAARPGDIPVGFDSKEYTMAVIRFLSSDIPYLHEGEIEYRSKDDGSSQEGWDQLRRTLPVLPLIKATNPEVSVEQRCYGRVRPLIQLGQKERKQYADAMDQDEEFRRKVLNLELIFSSSLPFSSPSIQARLSSKLPPGSSRCPNSSHPTETAKVVIPEEVSPTEQKTSGSDLRFAFQRFVPRRKLVPSIDGGAKEELTLMISGHMQQPENTPGPKPRLTKSRREALLSGPITAPIKSVSSATSDELKGLGDSNMIPSKRKHDSSTE